MRRRTALKTLTSASVGLSVAGCLGDEETPGESTTSDETTSDQTTTASTAEKTTTTTDTAEKTTASDCPPKDQPAPTCSGGWEHVGGYVDDETPPPTGGGFELTVEPATLALGDCVTFRLTNRTDEEKATGIRDKYVVHRETADGWRSVLFSKSGAYVDLGILHPPDEGFVWNRRFSPAGLSGHGDRHSIRACEPLQPGTYRFVYWGGAGSFDALGVRFEVTA